MIERAEGERLRDYARRLQDERNRLVDSLRDLYRSEHDRHAEIMRTLEELNSCTLVLEVVLDRLLQED